MRRRAKPERWIVALALAIAGAAGAQTAGGPKLLPAEQAFALSGRALDAKTLEVRFNVADGYYLYRDKLAFAAEPAPAAAGKPDLPAGKPHQDEFFGKVSIYRGLTVARVPVAQARPGQDVTLVVHSQGCADAGVCYPPQVQRLVLKVPAPGAGPSPAVEAVPSKPAYFK
jgi:thiol:disulfide interchange protein DsbD